MRHFINHWRNVGRLLFLVGLFLIAACQNTEAKYAHKNACEAKGSVEIFQAGIQAESCEQKTARLQHLVETDEDCKAYFSDRKIQVSEVCNDE